MIMVLHSSIGMKVGQMLLLRTMEVGSGKGAYYLVSQESSSWYSSVTIFDRFEYILGRKHKFTSKSLTSESFLTIFLQTV